MSTISDLYFKIKGIDSTNSNIDSYRYTFDAVELNKFSCLIIDRAIERLSGGNIQLSIFYKEHIENYFDKG